MIAIFAALKFEIHDLMKRIEVKEKKKHSEFSIIEGVLDGQPIILVITGIGKNKATNAAQFVLDHYSPETVLSVGLAGAVRKGFIVGDLVVCQSILCQDNEPIHSALALVELALKDRELFIITTNILTVPKIIFHPRDKEKIGTDFSVSIVDMESYWIGQIAKSKGLPFITIRAISDPVQERIPDFNHPYRLIYRPTEWRRLRRLLIHCLQARKTLNTFLLSFIEKLKTV